MTSVQRLVTFSLHQDKKFLLHAGQRWREERFGSCRRRQQRGLFLVYLNWPPFYLFFSLPIIFLRNEHVVSDRVG